jgi:hypothetical protein
MPVLIAFVLGLLTGIKNHSKAKSISTTSAVQPGRSEEEIAARKEETQRRKVELRLQEATLAVLALYTLFTGWLLYETRISTIAVTKSTENTAQFFRTDERAWIELEP